jgi:predicted transcriptional regulator
MLETDPEATAEQAMEPGPSTVRRDTELPDLIERLRERDLRYALVSDPDGVLAGVVRRADAERKSS